jgi:hypothetical protein
VMTLEALEGDGQGFSFRDRRKLRVSE